MIEKFAAALNRRDRDGWVAAFHPEFEGYSGLVAMEGGETFRGQEGAGTWFDNLLEVYQTVQATPEQTIVVGDHALHLGRVEYVGKGNGVTLETVLAWVTQLRDGRFVYAHSHFEVAEGFRDLADRIAGQ